MILNHFVTASFNYASVKTSDFEFGSGNYVSFKFSADEK